MAERIENIKDLNENQLDALREIGNIGMGSAATALSQMLNNRVDMTIPSVELMDNDEAQIYMRTLEPTALGITIDLRGDANGVILHVLQKSFANKIINFFFPHCLEDIKDIDEMSMSVISEVGNITSAAYVNALAYMTESFIDISTPTPCTNLSGSVTELNKNPMDKLLLIDNSFFIDNEEVKSNLIFIPDIKSMNFIFDKLNIDRK